MVLRRIFDGSSMDFKFCTTFSSFLGRTPTRPAVLRFSLLESSLYPYRPCRSRQITARLQRRYRPQPSRNQPCNPLSSHVQSSRMNQNSSVLTAWCRSAIRRNMKEFGCRKPVLQCTNGWLSGAINESPNAYEATLQSQFVQHLDMLVGSLLSEFR